MKKTILPLFVLLSLGASAQDLKDAKVVGFQPKQDTTIRVDLPIDQFRALLYTIDQNIDSKKVSSELLAFIQKNAQMVADKPKEALKIK